MKLVEKGSDPRDLSLKLFAFFHQVQETAEDRHGSGHGTSIDVSFYVQTIMMINPDIDSRPSHVQ